VLYGGIVSLQVLRKSNASSQWLWYHVHATQIITTRSLALITVSKSSKWPIQNRATSKVTFMQTIASLSVSRISIVARTCSVTHSIHAFGVRVTTTIISLALIDSWETSHTTSVHPHISPWNLFHTASALFTKRGDAEQPPTKSWRSCSTTPQIQTGKKRLTGVTYIVQFVEWLGRFLIDATRVFICSRYPRKFQGPTTRSENWSIPHYRMAVVQTKFDVFCQLSVTS
jgi:hypothetical protein